MADLKYIGNPDFRGYLAGLNENTALNYVGNDGGVNRNELNEYHYAPAEGGGNPDSWYQDQEVNRIAGLYSQYQQLSGNQGVLGDNTGAYGGGSSTSSYDPADLAYLDDQKGALERQRGRTDTTLRNSLDAILQNYNKELSGANQTRSRNLEDFDTKTQTSEMGRERELGKVDTSARMLANSLRQKIGLASGSGSSAYQITAPNAVARQASEQRGDVLGDYAANFQALDTNKRRSGEDFESLLKELNNQRSQRQMGVEGDIATQRNEIDSNIGQLEGKRADILGGGYKDIRNAMNPWNQRVSQGESLIDGLYSKYAAKYNVNPIQERKTNLRDYAVDKTAVRDQQATGSEDPYAPFKNFAQEEDEDKVTF